MSFAWQLIAPPADALADAVQLLLQLRAQPCLRSETARHGVLIPPGRQPLDLADSTAILRALPLPDTARPDPREEIAARLVRALHRLEDLDPNAFPADLDLVIYALRQELRPLDALAPDHQTALSGTAQPQADSLALLAPLLWRLGLLDRHFHLFLLAGLPRLAALHQSLIAEPLIAAICNTSRAQLFLGGLKRGHPDRPGPTDWSRALGPEGREKSLPAPGQRRKNPSIGSGGHIR